MKDLKVLILEDNPFDAKLMELELGKAKINFISKIVETKPCFQKELKNFKPDLILSDYSLPQFSGLEALELVKKQSPEIPFIIVTGSINEETAVECMKKGAWDYILKDRLIRLPTAIENALKLKDERYKIKQTERALQESKTRYKNLYSMMRLMSDNLPDLVWSKDIEGNFIFVNKACSEILLNAKDTDEPIGKNDIYFANREKASHPDNPDYHTFGKTCVSSDLAVLTNKKSQRFDEFGNVKGEFIFLDIYKALFKDEKGNLIGTVGSARIVTKERQMEKALLESEVKFRKLLENIPTIAVQGYNAEGIIHYWNKANELIYGYTAKEAIGKNLVELIIPPEMRDEVRNIIKHGAKTGEVPPAAELTLMRKDGTPVTVFSSHAVVKQTGKEPALFCMDMDLTDRKQAEQIQKTLFNISNAINTTDKMHDLYKKIREYVGNVLDTTNFYVALYDKDNDSISFDYFVDKFVSEKKSIVCRKFGMGLTEYIIKTGKPLLATNDVVKELVKKGVIEKICVSSEIWLGVPLKIENQIIGIIAVQSYDDPNLYTEKDIDILTFISEKIALVIQHKKADEQIKRDLEIKNVLLREVHHRVKNNMQIISSMLKLQSSHIKNKKALKLFKNSQNRVKTMSLIHDLIYRSKDISNIDFADYTRKLTTQIFISYGINSNFIKYNINIKDILLDINTAIPCGLIINELVSNSLKYAFPKRKGEISISFTCKNQVNTLRVKDDGIGIPVGIDLKNSPTLGLMLVNSLTKQLNGTLKLEKVKGTSFKITFKKIKLKTYGKV